MVAVLSRFFFTVMVATNEQEARMGKLTGKFAITLAAAALVLGSMALTAGAQTQQPGSFRALTQNASPLVTPAACYHPGRWCPTGSHRRCGPYHCWCAPCW